ncbi:MAG: hypothetical protein KUG79_12665 [Pseudomonadales bacterium]|nr:hypothetical protein [Pseudomonadales bacterium]
MREAFRAFFHSIVLSLTAFNRTVATVDNYARWAEEESAAFVAEAEVEREARLNELKLSLTEVPRAA